MKITLRVYLLVLSLGTSISAVAQIPDDPSGSYFFKPEMKNGSSFEYELALNQNGTYYINILRLLEKGDDYSYSGIGHWELNSKGFILFAPSGSREDSNFDPDMSLAKARLVKKKSSWDPEGRYPYLLKFQRSTSNWVNGLELFPSGK